MVLRMPLKDKMITDIYEEINRITPINSEVMLLAKNHWDSIGKPLGSLGKLEELTIQIAGIQNTPRFNIDKRALIIMCADNGVVAEGVTQTGQEVTAIVAENFLDEKTCVALMCKRNFVDIYPIDIGMSVDTPRVEKHKIAYGTGNIALGPAMTRQQAIDAIDVGIKKVSFLNSKGYNLVATGEMGIGNTTTSSAITAVLLDMPVEDVTGKGAGLSDDGLKRKIEVIKRAIEINSPNSEDPIDVLSKLGGYDIAGLVGVFLGGAIYHVPILIDGFISAVAALLATKINPICKEYMLASHISKEPATQAVLHALKKEPILNADMHLGEGSGAVAIIPLLDMATDIYYKMSTFEEINVEAYQEYT